MTLQDSERALAYRINQVHLVAPWGRSMTYKLVREGRLPARRLGRATLVLARDLDDFLEDLDSVEVIDVA